MLGYCAFGHWSWLCPQEAGRTHFRQCRHSACVLSGLMRAPQSAHLLTGFRVVKSCSIGLLGVGRGWSAVAHG